MVTVLPRSQADTEMQGPEESCGLMAADEDLDKREVIQL